MVLVEGTKALMFHTGIRKTQAFGEAGSIFNLAQPLLALSYQTPGLKAGSAITNRLANPFNQLRRKSDQSLPKYRLR